MKPGIEAAGSREEILLRSVGCGDEVWDEVGGVFCCESACGPRGGWDEVEPFMPLSPLGTCWKLHLLPKRQNPFGKYLHSCESFSARGKLASALAKLLCAVCVYADRSSHPTRLCSPSPSKSVGDGSPNAESLTLKEPSRLHDSLRGVGVPGLSIGLCAAAAFCLGAAGTVPLLVGAATGSSDHLKIVGN
jgi:hypothetical protein